MIDKKQRMLIRFEVMAAFLGGMGFGGFLLGQTSNGVILSVFLICLTLLFKSFIYNRWKVFVADHDDVVNPEA